MQYLQRAWALYLIAIGVLNLLAFLVPPADGWALLFGVVNTALGVWTWRDSKTTSKALRPFRWEVSEAVMDGWVVRAHGRSFTRKAAWRATDRAAAEIEANKRLTMTKGSVR